MFSSPKVLCTSIILILVLRLSAGAEKRCVTPSQQSGRCVPDTNCPVYKKAYKEHFNRNVEYFRKLKCAYNESVPTVCCPDSGNYIVNITNMPTVKKYRQKKPKPVLANRFGEELLPSREECGKQVYGNRILDGEVTEIDEFPWMALLFYKRKQELRKYNFGCGGVLIQQRYVLTAAHCVTGYAYNALGGLDKIRLGEYNVDEELDCVVEADYLDCADPPVDRLPEKIILHPNYKSNNKDQENDIALIRLNEGVEYSDFIQPICLPDMEIFPRYNTESISSYYVAGWGRNESGQNSPVKLKLKVPLVRKNACINTYTRFNINIVQSQLCAGGERGRDSCKGDSGGPLMTTDPYYGNWISSGIVSIGTNICGTSGVPGIYTNVREYVSWIKDNLEP